MIVMVMRGLWLPEEVLDKFIQYEWQRYGLRELIELYQVDAELLYHLGVIGVPTHAPMWAKDAARLAKMLGRAVRQRAFIKVSDNHGVIGGKFAELWIHAEGPSNFNVILFPVSDIEIVQDFLDEFDPNSNKKSDKRARSLQGRVVSAAYVQFSALNDADYILNEVEERVSSRRNAKPVVTELDLSYLVAGLGVDFLHAIAVHHPDDPSNPGSIFTKISCLRDRDRRAFHETSIDIRKVTIDKDEEYLSRAFSEIELVAIQTRLPEICREIRREHAKRLGQLVKRFPSLTKEY